MLKQRARERSARRRPLIKQELIYTKVLRSVSDKRDCPHTFEVCIVPARLAKRISINDFAGVCVFPELCGIRVSTL